jgi:hypothetical protein
MEVTFTDWRNGFPFKIEFYYPDYETNGNKVGDPILWNPQKLQYENKPSNIKYPNP